MKQTEQNLKAMLSKLPNSKFKMLAEGIEISPFPVLINKEYKNDLAQIMQKLMNSLKKQMSKTSRKKKRC
jgi:hypothetical protein